MATGRTSISSSASMTATCARARAPPTPSASAKDLVRCVVMAHDMARECDGFHPSPSGPLPARKKRGCALRPAGLAREVPCLLGERAHHLGLGGRVLARGGAVAHAP